MLRDLGPGLITSKNPGTEPGLTIFSSGTKQNQKIGDSDLRDEKFRNSTLGTFPGTRVFRDSVPGTEYFPGHGRGHMPTPG